MNADVVVIGGGVVGSAIAYGLTRHDLQVLVLDGGDGDYRASAANFGLVWSHGMGLEMPAYHELTRQSLDVWSDFSRELGEASGIDLQYDRNGGLVLCLGEDQLETRRAELMKLHNQVGDRKQDWEILDRDALAKLLPKVPFGRDVMGASLGIEDGQCNPLQLLSALRTGIVRRGGQFKGGSIVQSVRSDRRGGFEIDLGCERILAGRVVISAGLGSMALAAQLGLEIPLRPLRGQVLVTERLEPLLPISMSGLRQTAQGTVMIGATYEDVGYDVSTTAEAAAALSANAVRRIPALKDATLVRQWSGLRIMTLDSHPVYAQSESHPGAFAAICHSGVSLAAAHASLIADAVAAGAFSPFLDHFHHRRFDVSKAA